MTGGAPIITGIGVTTAVGQGPQAFARALWAGESRFTVMQREGRQLDTCFVGAEIPSFQGAARANRGLMRTSSLTAQVVLATVEQAWLDAGISDDETGSSRIGLVVGGTNVQQRELTVAHDKYRARPQFLRPSYGLSFLDTDICGLCTATFGIRGFAHTVGGACASGQLAIIEAAEAVVSGRVDTCIAVGALMDLSYWECLALQSMGAMIPARCAGAPDAACRPFDRRHCGFAFGESCGAIVVERASPRRLSSRPPYATLSGWSVQIEGNRNPEPSVQNKVNAIRGALARAQLSARQIDYVNPHGTGSVRGDESEVAALRACELTHSYINATKSITGHGFTAAGAVEAVATLVQMKARTLHPSRNLDDPIDPTLRWVRERAVEAEVSHSLSLSAGFGGIDAAVCFSASEMSE
jgi:malonyl-ACP decarboxylase